MSQDTLSRHLGQLMKCLQTSQDMLSSRRLVKPMEMSSLDVLRRLYLPNVLRHSRRLGKIQDIFRTFHFTADGISHQALIYVWEESFITLYVNLGISDIFSDIDYSLFPISTIWLKFNLGQIFHKSPYYIL